MTLTTTSLVLSCPVLCYACRLVEECWHPQAMARPTFSEIIIRLDKIYAHFDKHGSWKDSLKLWSVSRRLKRIVKRRSVRSRIHTEP